MLKLEKQTPKRGAICPIQRVYMELNAEDAETFLNAVNDPTFSKNMLIPQLRAQGIKLSGDSLYAHRNLMCLCQKVEN